jgi:hypothetical protein
VGAQAQRGGARSRLGQGQVPSRAQDSLLETARSTFKPIPETPPAVGLMDLGRGRGQSLPPAYIQLIFHLSFAVNLRIIDQFTFRVHVRP